MDCGLNERLFFFLFFNEEYRRSVNANVAVSRWIVFEFFSSDSFIDFIEPFFSFIFSDYF